MQMLFPNATAFSMLSCHIPPVKRSSFSVCKAPPWAPLTFQMFPGKCLSIPYSHEPFVLGAVEAILELSIIFTACKWRTFHLTGSSTSKQPLSRVREVTPVLQSTVQLAWMRQFWILNTVTIPVEIFSIYFVSASLRKRVIRPSDSSQPWHALPHSMDAGWLTYWNIPTSNSKRESHPWWKSIQGIPAVMISQMNWLLCGEDATLQEAPASESEIFPYPVSCYQNAVPEASSTRAVNSIAQEKKLTL